MLIGEPEASLRDITRCRAGERRAGERRAGERLVGEHSPLGGVCGSLLGAALATTHHSFLSSFSAMSKRNFATKYAFCSKFQNLQDHLAGFLKILQNFAEIRKILETFGKISGILQEVLTFYQNR